MPAPTRYAAGSRLRAAREAATLSVEEVAVETARSAQAVGAWERGQNRPPDAVLLRLARLYGVELAEIQ